MTPNLVVLDRDGVINQDSDAYIKTVEEWVAIDSSIEAIVTLQQQGITVAIATNQSGIGRGYYTAATMHAMHQKMNDLIVAAGGKAIEHIAYCPHSPDEQCDCRKPKPGLLDQIARQLNINIDSLEGVPFVGDSLRDLQAGEARNMLPVLVRTGKGLATEAKLDERFGGKIFNNLADFSQALLA